MYKHILRPILFLFDPEKIHHLLFLFFRLLSSFPGVLNFFIKRIKKRDERLTSHYFGLDFPNPVGLAAGLDKNAIAAPFLAALGFGFIEIGTVTPVGQKGNPRPRLFRLKRDEALINRMGFNNEGLEAVKKRLKYIKNNYPDIIIGCNIGKNTTTSNTNAVEDYVACFNAMYRYADYFTVNVSCPNIANISDLQDKDALEEILTRLTNLNEQHEIKRPILLKISPDLTFEQIDDIIDIVKLTGIDGIVATNTTNSRKKLDYSETEIEQFGKGGLSGKPLCERSTEVIRYISHKTNKQIPIIGVGGIFSYDDVKEKLDAGASLVQLYTGFIYEGPFLVSKIRKALLKVK
jgi:dihydroorotate dehydrogenase